MHPKKTLNTAKLIKASQCESMVNYAGDGM